MRSNRFALWAVLGVTAAAIAYDVVAFDLTNDITSFMPPGERRELVRISSALSRSDLSRTMVLTVGADGDDAAEEARRRLVAHLEADPAVESVHSEIDDETEQAFYDVYFPRRLSFVVDDPAEAEAKLSDEGLRASVRDLKSALAGAGSSFVSRLAPEDPLLAFPQLLERLAPRGVGSVRAAGGRLVTADGERFVVIVTTGPSAFDTAAQGPYLERLDAARGAIAGKVGQDARIEMSGAHLYAVESERSIRSDVQRISIASVVAIVLLYSLLFRSLRPPVAGIAPIGIGFAVALAVVLGTSGRVHGVTLAFGSALIGVAIDYATHFYSHLFLSPTHEGPEATMRRVWPGVAVGAVTTVVGLAALAVSPFGAIREIGVFAAVGVLGAMVAARFVLPSLSRAATAPEATRRLASTLARGTFALTRPRWLVGLALATVALCAVGLPRFGWVDDVTALTSVPADVRAESRRVQDRIGRSQGGRYVVAVGDTVQEALHRNDAAARRLEEARAAGDLEGFQSIARLLPSEATQRARRAAVEQSPELWPRFRRILEEEGFRPDLFRPFAEALEGPAPDPLRLEDLRDGPLGPMVSPLVVTLDEQVAVLTPVEGVASAERLDAQLAGVRGAHYLDQEALLEEAYGRLRRSTLWLIGLGLLLVAGALLWRYRHLPTSLAVFLPAAAAATAAVAAQGLAGGHGNLMTVVGVLLVLSMGVDYGVFVAEARRTDHPLDAPVLSLGLGALTTSFSFGALAVSSNEALAAIGATAALGVLFAAVLVPAFAAAAAGRRA